MMQLIHNLVLEFFFPLQLLATTLLLNGKMLVEHWELINLMIIVALLITTSLYYNLQTTNFLVI